MAPRSPSRTSILTAASRLARGRGLERKLVRERRGGYCFEQNLLLKAALEALGAEVELCSRGCARRPARRDPSARAPAAGGRARARETWHADVGFGLGTLFEPFPSDPARSTIRPVGATGSSRTGDELVFQTVGRENGMTSTASLPADPRDRHRDCQLVDLDTPPFAVRDRTDRQPAARRRAAHRAQRLGRARADREHPRRPLSHAGGV